MYLLKYKKIISGILVLTIVISLYTPIFNKNSVPETHAIFGIGDIVFDPSAEATRIIQLGKDTASLIEEHIQTAANVVTAAVGVKELAIDDILDGIGWALAKTALRLMTQSIVSWINSGFEGSPAFVTDLEGFLLDVADTTAGEFIHGSELGFICSPFRLDVQIALEQQYLAERDFEIQCTLSDAVDNVESFLAGNFKEGGWKGWFELTQNRNNTPSGALLEAKLELNARLLTADSNARSELQWGSGFMSFKVCNDIPRADGTKKKNCTITIPAQSISNELNAALGYGPESLIVADEINEIIGALFAQIGQQVLTGAGGLLGLSKSGSAGGGSSKSYLDALGSNEGAQIGLDRSLDVFKRAIAGHQTYVDINPEIASDIRAVIALNKKTKESSVVIDSDGIEVACYNLAIPRKLTLLLNTATSSDKAVGGATVILKNLFEAAKKASTPEERLALFEQLELMQKTGVIKNEVDTARLEADTLPEVEKEIKEFEDKIKAEAERCRELQIDINDGRGRRSAGS